MKRQVLICGLKTGLSLMLKVEGLLLLLRSFERREERTSCDSLSPKTDPACFVDSEGLSSCFPF